MRGIGLAITCNCHQDVEHLVGVLQRALGVLPLLTERHKTAGAYGDVGCVLGATSAFALATSVFTMSATAAGLACHVVAPRRERVPAATGLPYRSHALRINRSA
jgi:hypothetical protein